MPSCMAGESLKCKCLLWILILWLFFNGLLVKRGVVGLAAGICITTWFSFCPSWRVLRNHDSRTLCGETRTSCNVQQVICTPAWTHWITGRSGFCKPKTLMDTTMSWSFHPFTGFHVAALKQGFRVILCWAFGWVTLLLAFCLKTQRLAEREGNRSVLWSQDNALLVDVTR